jgi:hypothetical protein
MNPRLVTLSAMTGHDILSIREPERLFTGDTDSLKKEYRHLAVLWHPDRCSAGDADIVFAHIHGLFDLAVDKLGHGEWDIPGRLSVKDADGKTYRFRYRRRFPFELGETLIGDTFAAFFVEPDHKALFDNAVRRIVNFTFASDAMKREVSRYLPEIRKTFETRDGRHVLVTGKQRDMIRLRDVLYHFTAKGFPDQWPRHAAWIQSTLNNLCCYLEYAGLTHNDISPDTYYISPSDHSGSLLGGWWYSEPAGGELKALPLRTYDLMAMDMSKEKIAGIRTDLELVKATGREVAGCGSGMAISGGTGVPESMAQWLRFPTTGDAVRDYRIWRQKILIESFGGYAFVELDLKPEDVYPEK